MISYACWKRMGQHQQHGIQHVGPCGRSWPCGGFFMVAVYVAGASRSLIGHHGTVAYDGHSPLNGGHLRLDDHRYATMFHRALELMRSWRERDQNAFFQENTMFLTICGFVARTFRSTSASISDDSVRCHFNDSKL